MPYPKLLEDYKKLAIRREYQYILDHIPFKNVRIPIEGWKCSKGHVWKASYNNIDKGRNCPTCAGKLIKILTDYQKLAIEKGFTYILDDIPETTHNTHCNQRMEM